MLNYAFQNLGFKRVEFRVNNDNKKSIAVMKSIGCTIDGFLLRYGFYQNGFPRNSIVLSTLNNNWLASVRQQLINKL